MVLLDATDPNNVLGCTATPPYLDEYGEADPGLRCVCMFIYVCMHICVCVYVQHVYMAQILTPCSLVADEVTL